MMKLTPRRYGVKNVTPAIPPPVLNWRMNESSGNVIDYSGNGYTGRVDGTPSRNISAYGGNSGIRLDSSGQGISINKDSCPLARDAMLSQNYTASMVIEDSSSGTGNPCPFIFWVDPLAGTKVLRLGYSDPSYASWTSSGGVSDYGAVNGGATTGIKLITFVRTPTLGTLYRDGIPVATKIYSAGITVAGAGSYLMQVGGHLDYAGSYQYQGRVSDLNIWNVALSPEEVTALFNQNGRY